MLRIKVPATSANLCIGFDTLGIAFNIYNTFGFERAIVDDVSAFDKNFKNNNLVLESYSKFYEYYNIEYIPVKITPICIGVPESRGLGSSATCIVAGVCAANIISGLNLSKEELLDICASIEGHPDNVLPALIGGLCAAFKADKYYFKKYNVSSKLNFYSLVPNFKLQTEKSRSVLPKCYSRDDVVHNLSRIVHLPDAFSEGNLTLIKAIFNDRIHEPYRYDLIPNSQEVKEYFKDCALAISGAGSSLLLICDKLIVLKEIYGFKVINVLVDSVGCEIDEC